VNLGVQAREDLQVLLLVVVFAIRGDLCTHLGSLLLGLPDLDPLLGGQVLTDLSEGVGSETQPGEKRAVGDGIEHHLVIGSIVRS
jgi:hypothetical protein